MSREVKLEPAVDVERSSVTIQSSIKLIGHEITADITVEGTIVKAYLDSGSQVSTISEQLVKELQLSVHPLEELLQVKGAGGVDVPYIGMTEAEMQAAEWVDPLVVPLLVVPMNVVNQDVPVLLGTNVLAEARLREGLEKSQWQDVQQLLARPLSTAISARKLTVKPGEKKLMCARVKLNRTVPTVMAEETQLHNLPGGLLLTPSVTFVQSKNRIKLQVQNTSSRTITIPKGHSVCEVFEPRCIRGIDSVNCKMLSGKGKLDDAVSEKEKFFASFELDHHQLDQAGQLEKIKDMMWSNRDVFSTGDLDLGCTDIVKHSIKLHDETPFRERYRRIPPGMIDEVKQHLEDMKAIGAIRPSHSPYASPVVIVKKKDGSLRFCLDLRKLNAKSIRDAYSIPRVEESLDMLSGSNWFSSLDLKSGYWQVEIEECDKPKTAFTVGPLGFWECNRMPFGLTNAPATFQRLMETALEDTYLNFCLVYLDDIVVFSRTLEDHLVRLQSVLDKLRKSELETETRQVCFLQATTQVPRTSHIEGRDSTRSCKDRRAEELADSERRELVEIFCWFYWLLQKVPTRLL